jgi:hypothetical protein
MNAFDDPDWPSGGGTTSTAIVLCPYCGEAVTILLDPGGGPDQKYVEDCEVCCRPWQVRVRYPAGGGASVQLEVSD